MLTTKLQGGLGNWLFQIAAGETISKQTNRTYFISSIDKSCHSNIDYFENIIKHWKGLILKDVHPIEVYEPSFSFANWNDLLGNQSSPICLIGYFQNYKYIPNDFIERLSFDKSITEKYSKLENSAFIHIRGTDYKNHWLHDVKLDSYYWRALNRFPKDTHFYIFTNDRDYAASKSFLKDIQYTFVDENEMDSLYLMSQCKVGGICANSSFSWWGAHLNPNRIITMPSKWYNQTHFYIDGYYFNNVIKIDVENNWNFIDKVVYINLDKRTDRNEHMNSMTSVFSNKVMRFSGIEYDIGSIGCTKSHIAVLEMAIRNNWKNVLILEDDATWNKLEEGYVKLETLVNTNYDVIVLGGTFVNRNGNRLISCKTTVGYLVSSKYFNTLLENFKDGLKKLEETHNYELFTVDSYWSKLQQTDNWFIITPCLIYQRPDYSNICNSYQDYSCYFELS
jgi:glycosyl transferase family 25